ncbi:unnamed protein product [Colias eurytheme]|nr:unnamed protein product [Colias eurytheme]
MTGTAAKFVRIIEKYPCLYNNNLAEYARKYLPEKAWSEVAKEIQWTGYTYRVNIYAGKQHEQLNITPQSVVMNLCQDLLNKGHCLYTDNWYTSVSLARELMKNETHLIGTLRKNRKHFPKVIVSTKLKKASLLPKKAMTLYITVLRWNDKRDVLVLSTKHSTRFLPINKHNKTTMKPAIVLDYNKAKGAVDLSDQGAIEIASRTLCRVREAP